MRTGAATGCLLIAAAVLAAVLVSADRGRPAVDLKPGPFKMTSLEGGGALPATGPIIRVPYDRIQRRYVQIDQEPLSLRMTIMATCKGIKFRQLTATVGGQKIPVPTSGLSKAGDVFTGATTVTSDTVTTAVLRSFVPDPVATCNADLESFVERGQQGKAQKGWAREYKSALPVDVNAFCLDEPKKGLGFDDPPHASPSDTARFPIWIHCRPAAVFKTVGTTPDVPAKKSGFQSAKVFINPPAHANYRGACPKELAFGGEIEYLRAPGNTPVEVRYRYRTAPDGATSPIFTTTFMQSGKKNITYWKHEFGGGSPTSLAAPGGGGKRVIDGGVRLEVLGAEGDVIGQDNASFKLTCEPTRVSGDSAMADGSVKSVPYSVSPVPAPDPPPDAGRGMKMQMVLPDLVVKSAQEAPTSRTTLRIEVANIGGAASQPTTLAVFYTRSGHVVKTSFDVPAIGPGQSRWVVANVGSPIAHAQHLTARINDSGGAKESDQSNNTLTIK